MNMMLSCVRKIRLAIAFLMVLMAISQCVPGGQSGGQLQSQSVPPDHAARIKQGTALFQSDVRQILITHCLDCHGGKSVKADFDLSSHNVLMESGYVGDTVEDSHLMQLITHTAEPNMPLKADKLSDDAIEKIGLWISMGAPYDKPLVEGKPDGPRTAMQVTDDDRKFWSFQKLKPVDVPDVDHVEWCRTPIDRFILSKQEEAGLLPNAPASARILLRRATFDLLGLPATRDEVEEFSNDPSPEAWHDQVDRLLTSPHYGERWARHWMDVARFAESHGYEQDYDRPNAYHYRDFLIKAFNSDLPFDQFVKWQLAGDEVAPDNPLAMMATGFLGAGAFPTQLTEAEFESARYDELDDMVTTTGVAFLGLSVGCARCHDHKFDPIPSVDYYRMAATFTSAIRSEIELDLEPEANRQRRQQWDDRLAELQADLESFEQTELPQQFTAWLPTYQPGDGISDWEILNVVEIKSENGSKFESQGDGSWLAVGSAPEKEVVTIIAESRGRSAASIRLEVLTHDSLPQKGPGRAGNGNFALGSIQVESKVKGESDTQPSLTKMASARATHQQNLDSLSVAASIDDDPVSGWAVDAGGIGKDQAAVFEFTQPAESPTGFRWIITLREQHPNARHSIGRFRLSIGNKPGLSPSVGSSGTDPAIAAALEQAKTHMNRDSYAWRTAQNWFATTLPKWQVKRRAVDEHQTKGPELKLAKVMVTSEGLPKMSHHADGRGFPHFYPETYILTRGDVHQKQSVATAGFLQVLMPGNSDERSWRVAAPDENSKTSFRRASLANWMTDVEDGAGSLVARVIVNRIWQHHFGRGLVASPNDFGVSGERPAHPELLDWLASDLVEHGWQLKRLHRLIMTSSVYMQSAHHDEHRAAMDRDNMLLWRWTPRRLEAEAVRDSMLAVSGQLDRTMYGPGTLDQNMTRRSIYFFIKRSQLIPMMMLFDWPEHLVSIGQRSTTTIAPQALMFMNSPQGRDYANALAGRLTAATAEDAVAELWNIAFVRSPTDDELTLLSAFVAQQTAAYQEAGNDNPHAAALVDLCQTVMSMNEFVYVE